MKFVYYEADTGEIKQITPVREMAPKDPYIEVDDYEVEELFSGAVSTLRYYVKPASKTKPIGKIVKKEKAQLNWSSINDWLYLVPQNSEVVEVRIKQNIKDKTVDISLETPKVKEWWANSGYFGRKLVPFTACLGSDPHNALWTKWVPCENLIKGVNLSYQGEDNFRIYTHKFFDYYLHERTDS